MKVTKSNHPSPDVLQAFGLGKLNDDATIEELNHHLETCNDCRDKVASVSGDRFVAGLRQARAQGAESTASPARATPRASIAEDELPAELRNNATYEIVRVLGRGGMGVVYLAKHKLMDRIEVLKLIQPDLAYQQSARQRFLREIKAAASLSHENVVRVHNALDLGKVLVCAMEHVDGPNLGEIVEIQGTLPIGVACNYAHQVALGLQHAFERNLVHRDIKPGNLVLTHVGDRQIVKILDFGLAKAKSEEGTNAGLTGTNQVLGTPLYMAPEQRRDASTATIRADIYSLGCTLYCLLTGAPPFPGKDVFAILLAHEKTEAKPLNEVRKDIPVALANIVKKMLAKDPKDRYQTPAEAAQALAPFIGPTPAWTPPAPSKGGIAPETVGPLEGPRQAAPQTVVGGRSMGAAVTMVADQIKALPAPVRRASAFVAVAAVLGVALICLLSMVITGMWAGGMFRARPVECIIVLEDLPDEAEVFVDGEQVPLKIPLGKKPIEIRIKVGSRKLEVYKDGFQTFTRDIPCEAGGRIPIKVQLERAPEPEELLAEVTKEVVEAKKKVEAIDPRGKWKDWRIGANLRAALWVDEDGWHFRTTNNKSSTVPHTVSGKITVNNGSIVSSKKLLPKNYSKGNLGVEPTKKKHLSFSYMNKGQIPKEAVREAGFDFQVSAETTRLDFFIMLDGIEWANHVYIGEKGENPKKGHFSLAVPKAGVK